MTNSPIVNIPLEQINPDMFILAMVVFIMAFIGSYISKD